MTKTRWILAVAVLAVVVLALAGGIAYAAGRPAAAAVPAQQGAATAAWQACDRVHDSAAMQQMRGRMPAQGRQRHDAMHEQMEQTASQMMSGQMMTGGGMMNR
jgi:hypothetical protein